MVGIPMACAFIAFIVPVAPLPGYAQTILAKDGRFYKQYITMTDMPL